MPKKKLSRKKVTILWGLPGSGKTFYKDQEHKSQGVDSIDVDAIARETKKYHGDSCADEVAKQVGADTCSKLFYKDHVIVDGLITTNAVARRYLEKIKEDANGRYTVGFEIVWWTPDREACKYNDQGRRRLDSKVTIENMPFEEPDPQLVKDFKAHVVRKNVIRKEAYRAWANKIASIGCPDSETIESATWSLGGEYKDYNGISYAVTPQPQPASFDMFDKLLEKICPTISFLAYKKLYRECVVVKETSSSDYYGGTTYYACYVCNLKKLYDMLVDMEIIIE